MTKLKNCPECQKPPFLERVQPEYLFSNNKRFSIRHSWRIGCKACSISCVGKNKKITIEGWNTRKEYAAYKLYKATQDAPSAPQER